MTTTFFDRITRQCPLSISWASWEDPALVVRGDDWSLSTLSSWRITRAGYLLAGWDDSDSSEAVVGLRGASVV